MVLRFWQYSSSTRLKEEEEEEEEEEEGEEEEEDDKEHEKTSFAVFPGCYVENKFIFGEFILFFMF